MLRKLRAALRKVADPAKAPIMQKYMRSSMPYLGVQTPLVRATCRQVFADLDLSTSKQWQSHVLEIWRGAKFREERYAALALAGDRRARPFHRPDAMPMYEEMIVTGAWWDFVDDIATHRIGDILRKYPQPMTRMMRTWARSQNLWKRRTAILCQLHFKEDTDVELLHACIGPSLGSKEFFLQKAIGWALRQYARVDPEGVRAYVRANESRMAPLSRREALKHLT
ncbi:MAG TPA: DNA alkylation repair protein [Steroidobacteraceae bacterium]